MEKCEYCGTGQVKLKRCGQCRKVAYCSVDCQKKDWKRKHSTECKAELNKQKFIEKELQRINESTSELEEDLRKMHQQTDPKVRDEMRKELEFKSVMENSHMNENFEEMLLDWANTEVIAARREAIRRNDPFVLVKFARDRRNPIRPRAVAADFACTMFWLTNQDKGNEDVIEEMTYLSVEAGLPSACLTQADEALEHNDLEAFEYYLGVAAKGGCKEAAMKLREYQEAKSTKAKPKKR